MPRRALAAALAAALVAAVPAAAHIVASPAFLASGSTATIELSVPNERDSAMTGLAVTVPKGIDIVEAVEHGDWNASVEGRTATWTGGRLAPALQESFALRLAANVAPGQIELEAEQRYADGKVRWPVVLTVVPGSSQTVTSSETSKGVVAVVVALGLLAAAGVGLLAWRRRV